MTPKMENSPSRRILRSVVSKAALRSTETSRMARDWSAEDKVLSSVARRTIPASGEDSKLTEVDSS